MGLLGTTRRPVAGSFRAGNCAEVSQWWNLSMPDRLISQRTSTGLPLALTAVVAVILSLLPRIPRPQSYHLFADRRGFLRIPNFGDVVSNVPFWCDRNLRTVVPARVKSKPVEKALSPLARTMALRARFHWLAPNGIRFVLLSLVSEQCATGIGSTADDDRIHGDGSCDHLGGN